MHSIVTVKMARGKIEAKRALLPLDIYCLTSEDIPVPHELDSDHYTVQTQLKLKQAVISYLSILLQSVLSTCKLKGLP
jgi:hypothetical protein